MWLSETLGLRWPTMVHPCAPPHVCGATLLLRGLHDLPVSTGRPADGFTSHGMGTKLPSTKGDLAGKDGAFLQNTVVQCCSMVFNRVSGFSHFDTAIFIARSFRCCVQHGCCFSEKQRHRQPQSLPASGTVYSLGLL